MSDVGFDRWLAETIADPPPKIRPLPAEAAAALFNAQVAVRDDPVRARIESAEAVQSRFFMKCLRLSGGSLEVMEALLRDEPVPISRLDPSWIGRYGLREVRGVAGGG